MDTQVIYNRVVYCGPVSADTNSSVHSFTDGDQKIILATENSTFERRTCCVASLSQGFPAAIGRR